MVGIKVGEMVRIITWFESICIILSLFRKMQKKKRRDQEVGEVERKDRTREVINQVIR